MAAKQDITPSRNPHTDREVLQPWPQALDSHSTIVLVDILSAAAEIGTPKANTPRWLTAAEHPQTSSDRSTYRFSSNDWHCYGEGRIADAGDGHGIALRSRDSHSEQPINTRSGTRGMKGHGLSTAQRIFSMMLGAVRGVPQATQVAIRRTMLRATVRTDEGETHSSMPCRFSPSGPKTTQGMTNSPANRASSPTVPAARSGARRAPRQWRPPRGRRRGVRSPTARAFPASPSW